MTQGRIANLSAYLRKEVASTVLLEIRPSAIVGAKYSLFTTAAISEGEEIFTSDPLITCVDDGRQSMVCDHCFSYARSAILPSGRFRQSWEGTEPFKKCGRCHVCYYCSKNCQSNAWRRYHRHECTILSERKDMYTRTRALCRLICMKQAGLIDAKQWDALIRLETHHEKYLRGPLSTMIVNTSIFIAMKTNMRISEVQQIYCAILTNSMSIKSADGSTPVLGTTLDLLGSFINHSCDPNSFVFFEGSQMRVRTLRPLRAGEEITQTYVDISASVFYRQVTTEKDYFFKCACERCKIEMKELRELQERATDKVGWMQKLDISQQRLLELMNNEIKQYNQLNMHIELANLEADAEKLIREPFPSGVWPDGMLPLPSVHGTFARVCKDNNDVVGALRYSLKASLALRKRSGQLWVHFLFDTVQIISLVVSIPEQHAIFEGDSMVSEGDCWNVLHGYLGELNRAAINTFGANSPYTKSIARLYSDAVSSADPPRPGTPRFRTVYNISQKRLLKWASMDENRGIDILA